MTLKRRFSGLVLASVILLPVLAGGPAAAEEAFYRESVVAGGPGKFIEVRHVVIRGSEDWRSPHPTIVEMVDLTWHELKFSSWHGSPPFRTSPRHWYSAGDSTNP